MSHALVFGPFFGVIYNCDWCDGMEERIFTDSTTELELCLECLIAIAPHVTMSPSEGGDNLVEALMEYAGERQDLDTFREASERVGLAV